MQGLSQYRILGIWEILILDHWLLPEPILCVLEGDYQPLLRV